MKGQTQLFRHWGAKPGSSRSVQEGRSNGLARVCWLTVWLYLVGVLALSGCIVIPTPEHGLLAGRGKIDELHMASLQVGTTTREAVVLRFGEPDAVIDNDRIFIYYWAVSRGYWATGYGYTGVGGDIPKHYLFLLEFDDKGVLSRCECTSPHLLESVDHRVNRWVPRERSSTAVSTHPQIMIDPIPPTIITTGKGIAAVPPVRVKIGEFSGPTADINGTIIGQKKAFGVTVANVGTLRRPADVIRSAVAARWESAGHRLVERGEDITMTGRISEFAVGTSLNLTTWDVLGTIEVLMEVESNSDDARILSRRYRSEQVEKTFFGPSDKHFETALARCLQDVMDQMASDEHLVHLLREHQSNRIIDKQ